ncbi:MAG: hypothetical protein Q4B08_13840 [Propionibacteriaceae bacterium]|nr:hypothetical protein [Propionibacteriaceae bacterium]
MSPLEVDLPWEARAVVGSRRFQQRLWRNAVNEELWQRRGHGAFAG